VTWRPRDVIALVLAIALALSVVGAFVAVMLNIIDGKSPTPTLGENTTQVLTAIVGGIVALLGAYIGHRKD
jgi:hypothetical protein